MTTLSNIGAIPSGGVAGSSKTSPKEDSDVRSAAHTSGLGGSAASATAGHDGNLLARAVEDVKKIAATVARNLQFSIDKDTGETVVKVVDATSGETIRQIPSEEMLAIAKAFKALEKTGEEKLPAGLLLKNKA